MKSPRTIAALTLAAATLTFSFGCCACNDGAMHEDKEKCAAPKPGTITSVNQYCAIMHEDPVDPALATAEWNGQKVGFCCAGCVPKWNKMTPAQKDAALAGALKAK